VDPEKFKKLRQDEMKAKERAKHAKLTPKLRLKRKKEELEEQAAEA